jgi:hypothetical protein
MSKREAPANSPAGEVIAATITVIGIPSAIQYYTDGLQFLISKIVIVPQDGAPALPAGHYAVAGWAVTFALMILIALICIVTIHILYLRRHARSESAASLSESAAHDEFYESYNKLCDSMQNVVQHIYNPSHPNTEPGPRHAFRKIAVTCEVNAHGDTRVMQQYEIEAGPDAVHFFKMKLLLDGKEPPINTLDDISFNAVSETPETSVDYFPTDFRGQRRDIAVFFLPELRPSEVRAFKIEFVIRGWFAELFSTKKSTNFPWANGSLPHTGSANVSLKFIFDKECGQIELENKRKPLPGDDIKRDVDAGRTVWTYQNAAADIRHLDWQFFFRKVA